MKSIHEGVIDDSGKQDQVQEQKPLKVGSVAWEVVRKLNIEYKHPIILNIYVIQI